MLWLAHAKARATLNKIDSVSGESRRALLIAPEDSDVLWFFPNFMDWSGNPSAVELLTRRALQLRPGSASVWYELGLYFKNRNRDDIGLNAFRRTALLDPAHSDAFTHISQTLCFIAEKRVQTGSLWRAPVILDPDDGVGWGRLAGFEFAVRGDSKIIGEMLSVAKPELREDPTVRRILAFSGHAPGLRFPPP